MGVSGQKCARLFQHSKSEVTSILFKLPFSPHGSFIGFQLITFSGSVACMSRLSGGDDELSINWQSKQ